MEEPKNIPKEPNPNSVPIISESEVSGDTPPPENPPTPEPPAIVEPNLPPPGTPAEVQNQENPIEEPKKSKGWLYAFIVVLILILIPAGLVFATEQNYLNLGLDKYYNSVGLERLWGGFPVSPTLAIPKANENMDKLQSYHFDAAIDLTGNLSLENIPQVTQKINPTQIVQNTEEGKVLGEATNTFSVSINAVGDTELPSNISATLAVTLSSQQLESLLSPSFSLDYRSVKNKDYYKIPALSILSGSDSNKWIEMDKGQYKTGTKETSGIEQKIVDSVKSGKRLGSEVLNGQNVYHYQVVLDKAKLNGVYNGVSIKSDPKADFWIGKKDHCFHKIKLDAGFLIESYQSEMTLGATLSLSEFNKKFNIAAPKEEEIAQGGVTELYQNMLNNLGQTGGAQTVETRDAQRKSDLAKIKEALKSYYTDNKKYPVSSDIDKTNDKSGVLSKALVPKYLAALPVDPNNPTYWYGYQSDGSSYTLWSLLENTADKEGKQDGKYFKYIITNE